MRDDGTGSARDEPAGPVGRLIAGRYRLAGLIGTGAMGAVWLAHDNLLDVDVAVKEIRPPWTAGTGSAPGGADESGGDEDSWANSTAAWVGRALREARNAARLRSNPHVVTVHDAVVDGGAPWIVMEAVAARSLQDAVDADGPRPLAEVATIGLAVLDALVTARDLGVVHRDVKPSNILLADDGRVLLTDFGIAAADTDPTLTHGLDGEPGLPSGTPAYIAPERLRGGPTTLAADLFALGATLLFAADGKAPFLHDSVYASLHAVLFTQPEPSRDLGPLAPVIAGLLAKDAGERLRADGARALLTRALRLLAAAPGDAEADRRARRWPPAGGERPDRAEQGAAEPPSASDIAAPGRRPVSAEPSAGAPDRRPTGARRAAPVRPAGALAASRSPHAGKRLPGRQRQRQGPRAGRRLPRPLAVAVVAVAVALLAGMASWGALAAGAAGRRPEAVASPQALAAARGATSTSGAPGTRAGAVPGEMLGQWRGTVTQGTALFDVTVRVTGGAVGGYVGTSHTSEGCTADLLLRETGTSTILVQEVITVANPRCTGAVRLTLSANGDGTLDYFYDATMVSSAGYATLTRTTASAPRPAGG